MRRFLIELTANASIYFSPFHNFNKRVNYQTWGIGINSTEYGFVQRNRNEVPFKSPLACLSFSPFHCKNSWSIIRISDWMKYKFR
ncbi:MAG: hypothetical protein DWQ02_28050 [Bacteroidetes bacterium]|nr:MAG: hypothetical protein DWQ02_28050 [Bacteroidota bacterium]